MFKIDRNLAIIIGINQYQQIPALKNAVADAVGLADVLKKHYGYKVLLLLNQRARGEKLNQLLVNLQNKTIQFDDQQIQVTSSDRLLFYFAGHGFAAEAQDSEIGKPAGYFMPQDAEASNKDSWLSMHELYETFSALNCHHLLMILDCCFAGRISWIGQGRNLVLSRKLFRQSYDRFIKYKTEQIITSAAHDEEAQDLSRFGQRGEKNGNSPFAHLLLKVLQGNSDGGKDKAIDAIVEDQVITVHELFAYLQNKLGEVAAGQTPGLSQPRKYDPETGEYVYLKGEYIFPLPKFNSAKLKKLKLDKKSNPYKGLASFDTQDSNLFFGRSTLSQQLAEKVDQQPLTIVLGVSGSGKSSLAKAGLIPTLQTESSQQWHILEPMRPGESPFKELNRILNQSKSSGSSIVGLFPKEKIAKIKNRFKNITLWAKDNFKSKLLLVIDQSEELITLGRDQEEQKIFLNLLAELSSEYPQLHLVLTLRSDFELQLRDLLEAAYWQEAWQQGRFIVTPMNREELQQAIEEPAAQRTLFFESPKLVHKLIDEAINRTGILPLLSFTLSELYLKYLQAEENGVRNDRTITEADYSDLDGMEGSLAQAAKRTYRELVKQKIKPSTINHVMLRMVSLNGSEMTRRRVFKSELNYPEELDKDVKEIVDRFVAARLFTTGKDAEDRQYVEPVHDALVTRWQKLILKPETQESLLLQRRLTTAAEEWENFNHPKQSSEAEVEVKTEPVKNSSDSRTYSIKNLINKINPKLVTQLKRSPKQPERSQDKPERFLWNASPYLDVLNKEVLNSSNNNWLNKLETKFVIQSIRRRRRNIQARRGFTLGGILVLSMLTIAALIGQRNAQISQTQALIESSDARFDAEQNFDALLDSLRAAKKLDESGLLRSFPPALALLPESSEPAKATKAKIAQILQQGIYGVKEYNRLESDIDSENEGGILEWSRNLISWSPDGEILAFATRNKTVKLWQPNSDGKPKTLEGNTSHQAPIVGVSWSNDGILATVSQDGTGDIWNQNGKHQNSFKVPINKSNKIYGVSWSNDGQFLAFPALDGKVYRLELTKSNISSLLPLSADVAVFALSWSRDGILAAGAGDGTVKLWSPDQYSPMTTLDSEDIRGWVVGVNWSDDGEILASASNDQVMLWNRDGDSYTPDTDPLKHPKNVTSLAWNRDRILASGSEDGTINLWRDDGTLLDTFQARGLVQSLEWSPDDQILATVSQDGTVQLWKLNSLLTTLTDHSEAVNTVSWNHDGKILASGSDDETIRLWHKSGSLYSPSTVFDSSVSDVNSLSWSPRSPDGEILAAAGYDQLELWERNGEKFEPKIISHFEYKAPHYEEARTEVNSVSWSANGQLLASATNGASVQLWEPDGKPIKTLLHPDWVNDVSWSQNGFLASAGKDGQIKIWNKDQGDDESVDTFNNSGGESELVLSLDWNTDQQIIASSHQDYTIKLWDEKGELLDRHKGHEREVLNLNWSPNGKFLASASRDSSIKLWKLDNIAGKPQILPITTLKGHKNAVNEVSWSPDGKSLATASSDTTVKLWQLDVIDLENESQFFQDLLVEGCNWMRPYLKNNPQVAKSDRTLCDSIARKAPINK